MKNKGYLLLFFTGIVFLCQQCKKDPSLEPQPVKNTPKETKPLTTTPYAYTIPTGFPTLVNIPADNPLTEEGVTLGKKLFYDPILSGNNKQSCNSCHTQAFSFSDNNKPVSKGIDGIFGTRNTPAIVNVMWNPSFFWDGRAATVEEQALGPVANKIEMHLAWDSAVSKLQTSTIYPELFEKAFLTKSITKELVVKAIAQFERTLISANSRYDKIVKNELTYTESEQRGYTIFYTEKGDCFHCHVTNLFTDNRFHNNGLDAFPSDKGLGGITKDQNDDGKFKTPTLRNISFSAPYMHDGRFKTLEEVVNFYSEGLKFSSSIDPLMKKVSVGGVHLNAQEKLDLIAFIKTLNDTSFVTNSAFAPN